MALDEDDLKAIAKMITDTTATALRPVTERLDANDRKAADAPDVSAQIAAALASSKPESKSESKSDPAMLAKLSAMEAKLEEQRTATQTAETARKSEKMLSGLRTALAANKVPANRIAHVVALLHDSQKRISLNDNGQPVIRFDRSSAGGEYQDHLGLKKGLEEFLGSDEGKTFLPAVQVQGSAVHPKGSRLLVTPAGKPNIKSLQNAILGKAFNL